MDESTTTGTDTATAAVDTTTQADGFDIAPAANTATESSTNTAQATAEPASAETNSSSTEDGADDNLAWLQKKGIDPNSPEAISKVAEMYRNAEKAMHQSTAKASELQKALGGDQVPAVGQALDIPDEILNHPVIGQLVEEIKSLKAGQTSISTAGRVNDFFSSTPDAKALEPAMAQIVTDNPVIGELVKAGHMSVQQLYAMARGSDAKADETLKQQGGKEALEQLADKQQAKAVRGSATSSALNTGKDDAFLSGFNNPY